LSRRRTPASDGGGAGGDAVKARVRVLRAMTTRIGLVQQSAGGDVADNRERAAAHVREAAEAGASLVVLPEIWNVGYFAFDEYDRKAEPLDGPTVEAMAGLADEYGVYVHAGSIVERDGDDLYNASVLVDADGEVAAVYRKVHLFGYESDEQRLLTPGEEAVTADTSFGTVGMATCYDLRFPELFREMAAAGARLVLVTSAWPNARLDHWQLLTRTRALENQSYLAAANLTGDNEGVELAGHSVVVDPWGVTRVDAGTGEGVTLADVDLETVAESRSSFPALADRRIEADRRVRPSSASSLGVPGAGGTVPTPESE
jgi:predicted amidohydrolase